MNRQFQPPSPDQLEISLFGPGYGEAIVIHLGQQEWVVVDSCLEPRTKMPAALEYLRRINVDAASGVRCIIATHWHDDHVRGLSEILRTCTSAKFTVSSSLSSEEFDSLVELYRHSHIGSRVGSGLREFVNVMSLLRARKANGSLVNPPKMASVGKKLYQSQVILGGQSVDATISAMSPSDASVLLSQLRFADLLKSGRDEPELRLRDFRPNDASVALWGHVGEVRFLLGADLERTQDPSTGWLAVIADRSLFPGRASAFKVAHHGSENGHDDQVWTSLLSDEPYAILTPWNKGSALPTEADIDRLTRNTSHVYITAQPRQRQFKFRNKAVQKVLNEAVKNIHELHPGWGQIRMRRPIGEPGESWQIQLFGGAAALRSETTG